MSLQTMPEKIGDTLRGLNAAAFAIGMEDHRRMLADAAQRTRDGHRAMMKAAMGESVQPESGDADMGDILVTGDIVCNQVPLQQAAYPAQTSPSSTLSKAAKAAMLGTALLGGGGLGAAATAYLMRPNVPPAAQSPTDEYGFDLLPADANQGKEGDLES